MVRGYAYNACVRSVLLYACETWAATQEDVSRLNRNDMMMIDGYAPQSLETKYHRNFEELRSRLGLCSIENVLRCGRLRWYGHVQRMDPDTYPRKVENIIVTGSNPRDRPRKTWMQCIKNDLSVKGLHASLAQNRSSWRRAIHLKSRSGRDNGAVSK